MSTAEEIYARFKHYPGSEYIASENAIRGLIRVLTRSTPQHILEMGSGIGTLTFAIIDTMDDVRGSDYRLVMVEDHEFCREQLPINLAGKFARGLLVRNANEVPTGQYDLIIIDGGDTFDGRYLRFLAPHGAVFVEGDRGPQRKIVEHAGRSFARASFRSMQMEHAAVHHKRNPGSGTIRWSGGYWVYQFEPTWAERARYLWCHFWEGLAVTKRRRLKVFRLAIRDRIGRSKKSSEFVAPERCTPAQRGAGTRR